MILRFLFAAGLALTLGVPKSLAESPPPFPDFEAKFIKPPKAGSGNRIKVQIDPVQPKVEETAAAQVPAAGATASTGYDWFWNEIPPGIDASGPGRLGQALQKLSAPPTGMAVAAPRLQMLQDIASAHGIEILKSTVGTQVSPALVLAVISVESAGRSDAVSGAGAAGLMQLMPATASRFGVDDRLSPPANIRGGVAFLNFLMDEFDRDPILVLAGYNAGENAVREHAGVPPYAETRGYVPKVLAAFSVARGLCRTPPELITDGCVFAVN